MIKVELKYEDQFKTYLSKQFDNKRVISDCISRCKRVQKYEEDLAEHFMKDRGQLLLVRLNYTMKEANQNISPLHSIPIQGSKGFKSIYEGTQSLNNAVKQYFEFMYKRGE